MIERTVPWWRRALKFALSGIRTGFGLFARNGRHEAGSPPQRVESGLTRGSGDEAGEDNELPTKELEDQEEDTELTHPSLKSEEVAAEVKPAAEIAVRLETQPVEAELVEAQSSAEEQAVVIVSVEEPAEPVTAGVGAATAVAPAEAEVEAHPVEAAAEADVVPEEAAAEKAVEEPAAASTAEAEPALAPLAVPAPIEEAVAQEIAEREIPPALPLAPERTQEQKTAQKVAAALKARGQDAEQSPFSVIVSQVYDGPLDLLLDLIRKQDIDIYDIPIAKITAQFLAYVDQLKASDMDVAGEFIYTASLLIHIKSKMLLPRAPAGPEDAVEDPRRELVERLLEHERFKNAAQMLSEKQTVEAATWTNPGAREFRENESAESETAPEIAADTVDLVRVFREILERARNRPVIDVEEDTVTVGQMIQFLARRLTMEDKPVALRRLLSHTHSERALIAMFLALLELVRLQAILLRQDRHFSEIFIKKHTGFDAAMNQGLANARDDWR